MKANSGEIVAKSPDVRLQIRIASDELNETSTTGESSPGQGVHRTVISDHFDGKISADIKSGKDTRAPVSNVNEGSHQMNPRAEDNLQKDQATAKDAAHHKGDEGESVRMTSVLNQGQNRDHEHTSNQRIQPLQQHQEKLFTMGSTDGKVQEKMQENQEPGTTEIQEAQLANDEVQSGISKDNQHSKGEKAKWKAKDTINSNANTMQQNKDNGRVQPGTTNKEKAGKFVNFVPNDADHSDTSRNKLHSGQNELGKGQVVVQAAGNEATGQAGKLSHISQDIDPKILPQLVKVSSNFDSYRPNHQRTN
ncbi:hypothetical protein KY285_023746 [Solanum tuberosum]|nr:hypothetical protein KY289_025757 [Solanum tuberosum]KAH0675945.1 hypothetical protein KY285_023746 [Solanum tuberosum]